MCYDYKYYIAMGTPDIVQKDICNSVSQSFKEVKECARR